MSFTPALMSSTVGGIASFTACGSDEGCLGFGLGNNEFSFLVAWRVWFEFRVAIEGFWTFG